MYDEFFPEEEGLFLDMNAPDFMKGREEELEDIRDRLIDFKNQEKAISDERQAVSDAYQRDYPYAENDYDEDDFSEAAAASRVYQANLARLIQQKRDLDNERLSLSLRIENLKELDIITEEDVQMVSETAEQIWQAQQQQQPPAEQVAQPPVEFDDDFDFAAAADGDGQELAPNDQEEQSAITFLIRRRVQPFPFESRRQQVMRPVDFEEGQQDPKLEDIFTSDNMTPVSNPNQGLIVRKRFKDSKNKNAFVYGIVIEIFYEYEEGQPEDGDFNSMLIRPLTYHREIYDRSQNSPNMRLVPPGAQRTYICPFERNDYHGWQIYAWNFGRKKKLFEQIASKFFMPANGSNDFAQHALDENHLRVSFRAGIGASSVSALSPLAKAQYHETDAIMRAGGKLAMILFVVESESDDRAGNPEKWKMYCGGTLKNSTKQGSNALLETRIDDCLLFAECVGGQWVSHPVPLRSTIFPGRAYKCKFFYERDREGHVAENGAICTFTNNQWQSRFNANTLPQLPVAPPSILNIVQTHASGEILEAMQNPQEGDEIMLLYKPERSLLPVLHLYHSRVTKTQKLFSAESRKAGQIVHFDLLRMNATINVDGEEVEFERVENPAMLPEKLSNQEHYDVVVYKRQGLPAGNYGDLIIQASERFIYIGPPYMIGQRLYRLQHTGLASRLFLPLTNKDHSFRVANDLTKLRIPPQMQSRSIIVFPDHFSMRSDNPQRSTAIPERVFTYFGRDQYAEPGERPLTNVKFIHRTFAANHDALQVVEAGGPFVVPNSMSVRLNVQLGNRVFDVMVQSLCNPLNANPVLTVAGDALIDAEIDEDDEFSTDLRDYIELTRDLEDRANDFKQMITPGGARMFFIPYSKIGDRPVRSQANVPPIKIREDGATLYMYYSIVRKEIITAIERQAQMKRQDAGNVSITFNMTNRIRAALSLLDDLERYLDNKPIVDNNGQEIEMEEEKEGEELYESNRLSRMIRRNFLIVDGLRNAAEDIHLLLNYDVDRSVFPDDVRQMLDDTLARMIRSRNEYYRKREVTNEEVLEKYARELNEGRIFDEDLGEPLDNSLRGMIDALKTRYKNRANEGWQRREMVQMNGADLMRLDERLAQMNLMRTERGQQLELRIAIGPLFDLQNPQFRVIDAPHRVLAPNRNTMFGFIFLATPPNFAYEYRAHRMDAQVRIPNGRITLQVGQSIDVQINAPNGDRVVVESLAITPARLVDNFFYSFRLFTRQSNDFARPRFMNAYIQMQTEDVLGVRMLNGIAVFIESVEYFL